MFLLRTLRNRGLPPAALEVVFSAVILSRIIYAVPAWGGFIKLHEHQRINKVLFKCCKFGYCKNISNFDALLQRADRAMFCKARNSEHCLHNLLPAVRESVNTLRNRGHPYVLPTCYYEMHKKSFIVRSLFACM